MALKIRLRKQGRTNRPFYRLIVADTQSPRDGKYVEMLGWYNPLEEKEEKQVAMNPERITHWLTVGAELSPKADALVARAAPQVIEEHRKRLAEKREKALAKKRAKKAAKAA